MEMSNGNYRLTVIAVFTTAFVTVIIALFGFSYQRSSEAYTTAIENQKKIAVIESQYQEIKSKLDELRSDMKILLSQTQD